MLTISASDRGINSGEDITVQLNALLRELAETDGEKTVVFAPGKYYINSAESPKEVLYITNSTGDNEWKADEKARLCNIGLYFKSIKDLTISAEGAEFILDGVFTNIVIDNCENITISGLELTIVKPHMHNLRVLKKAMFYVDFQLDAESTYRKKGRAFEFYATDYSYNFFHGRFWMWSGYVSGDDSRECHRKPHVLLGALKVVDKGEHRFRVYYPNTSRFKVGDNYVIVDSRRSNAGIFLNSSKNVSLLSISQHFNFGLAFVAQDTENITIDKAYFACKEGSERSMCSVADFLQVCACRGHVSITNSYFRGAGDDCLNVHGMHLAVIKKTKQSVTVRFSHAQSLGYNFFHEGDAIEYVSPSTLLPTGTAIVQSVKVLSPYDIELTVDSTDGCEVGQVVEDVDAHPSIVFANNTITRVATRGVLLTTSGKSLIENNVFDGVSMNAILASDDACNWYESGRVKQLCIRGNTFSKCDADYIVFLPENKSHMGAVHSNIEICNNNFNASPKARIYAKSTDNINIHDNHGEFTEEFVNCTNVQSLR